VQRYIEYKYFLKGYDGDWSSPTAKTEKEYTNLPKGKYTFIVKAFDNLGIESKPASYQTGISVT